MSAHSALCECLHPLVAELAQLAKPLSAPPDMREVVKLEVAWKNTIPSLEVTLLTTTQRDLITQGEYYFKLFHCMYDDQPIQEKLGT